MRCEVLAVGTELLLGQINDTNSAWIGARLAESGIDSLWQTKVGDNHDRIVESLRTALGRSDAVIITGGLGPTQDDITREALAEVMGVELVRDEAVLERIRAMFSGRGRSMPESNARQADVPEGASVIEQRRGTAPGLICPVGEGKVAYAVPGVPHEMVEMLERAILPDLRERGRVTTVIRSRIVRTWGEAESAIAERLGEHMAELDEAGPGAPTIAFQASGIEGIKVRITVKDEPDAADARLAEEEAVVRAVLGDIVFGVDDESMEHAVGELLEERGFCLGLAESVTGGLVGSRLTEVPGSSEWFRGSIVSYDSEVKFDLLGVPRGPVVNEATAEAMARGARRLLGSDVALAVTGVAGPAEQDGRPVGTVCFGVDIEGEVTSSTVRFPGEREMVRQFAAISLLDALRRRLLGAPLRSR
ncbi:MAG TPA: competence/damage-inducible protein A [Acidimicrobiales bacterium]|nr:competence/damage-inducible protein A [Acidimicrobiales bacterium]